MKDHNFISDTIVANHHLLLLGWYHASVSTSTRCIIGTRTLSPSNKFKYTGMDWGKLEYNKMTIKY